MSQDALPTLAKPAAVQTLRGEILASAGLDAEKTTQLVTKRLRVIDDAMDATKVDRVTFEGRVYHQFDDIDHRTRLAAGNDLDDILGLKRSKSADDKGGKQPITVNVMVNGPDQKPGVWARVTEVVEADH